MPAIPTKVSTRLTTHLKRCQGILAAAKARDVNESDTVLIARLSESSSPARPAQKRPGDPSMRVHAPLVRVLILSLLLLTGAAIDAFADCTDWERDVLLRK